MPHADRFTVGIMALVAEKERDMISQRTKDGLAAAKRRGTRLGNPRPVAGDEALLWQSIRSEPTPTPTAFFPSSGRSRRPTSLRYEESPQCLNARGFKTPNGRAFAAQSVKNLLDRRSRLEPAL